MSDLTQFLLDRIAEDEAVARRIGVPHWRKTADYTVKGDPGVVGRDRSDSESDRGVARTATLADAEHIARHDPARVLAECEAKRRIVDEFGPSMDADGQEDRWSGNEIPLRILATVYADHPDYREEWRP